MKDNNITIAEHSGMFTLYAAQQLPMTLDEAWDFFSNPGNLEKITPKEMGFEVTSEEALQMYQGQIISYHISIFPLVKSNWVTEIILVRPKKMFIDEQRFGPYAMWHHEHHFEEQDGGVLMQDKVSFKLPMGPLGNLVAGKIIKNKVRQIFEHRFETLKNYFPA